MEKISIRRLGADQLIAAAKVLAFLNPETPNEALTARIQTLFDEHPHYHLYGAFVGNDLLGVAGAWISVKIWCGRYLEIDNLIVDPAVRSGGIGTRLIERLIELALEQDCKIITLDSYSSNHASHRLYHRLGFEIWGFHFVKSIGDWKGNELT